MRVSADADTQRQATLESVLTTPLGPGPASLRPMSVSPDAETQRQAWSLAHQDTLDSILTKLTFIERRLMHYPSVEATECIKELHALIERYDIEGNPRRLLRRIKHMMSRCHGNECAVPRHGTR